MNRHLVGLMMGMSVVVLLFIIIGVLVAKNEFKRDISSHWSLADKSSTITEKMRHIDNFVIALEKSGLQGEHDAIIYKTIDNSFDQNLIALKSLQLRLHEIDSMDVASFEYQTAMQQITAQEQGEAKEMLDVFYGTWVKDNYFLLWDWVLGIMVIGVLITLIIGLYNY